MTTSRFKLGDRPRAIISALGSRGDVNPMLAIANVVQRMGMRPLIIVAEDYEDVVKRLGFDVAIGISHDLFQKTIKDPNIWHPIRGPRLLFADLVAPSLPKQYDLISSYYEPDNTILFAHPLDLASRIFRDTHPQVPLVSVHLAPATIRNYHDPPQLIGGSLSIRKPWWAVKATYAIADRTVVRNWLERPLNAFRTQLGLAPVSCPLADWWYSPDLVLCLFPETFGPRNLPDKFRFCGFPLYDGPESESHELPANLELDQKPIVFTAGSAHVSADHFFQVVVRYCTEDRLPGLLLAADTRQFPRRLPENIQVAKYIPLGQLLPHCRAIVHHGGIGTTSQALEARVPQVICPMAFDQFDNGRRVAEMGLGTVVSMRWLSTRRIRVAVERLSRANNSHIAIPAERSSGGADRFLDRVTVEVSRLLNG